MRVDFMINLACPPKAAFASPGLLPLLHANDARVAPLASHCRACPASRNGAPFSCWGAIGAPILESTEDWLDGLLDPDAESIGISLLDTVVKGRSGAPVAALRAQGAFERHQPYALTWCEDDDEDDILLTLTLDQILHAMLFSGPQPPSAMLIYLLAFRIIPGDAPPALFQASLEDARAAQAGRARAQPRSAPLAADDGVPLVLRRDAPVAVARPAVADRGHLREREGTRCDGPVLHRSRQSAVLAAGCPPAMVRSSV